MNNKMKGNGKNSKKKVEYFKKSPALFGQFHLSLEHSIPEQGNYVCSNEGHRHCQREVKNDFKKSNYTDNS